MSRRPTADIVADLRSPVQHYLDGTPIHDPALAEAADCLAELDADVKRGDLALRMIDALRPPCTTCGGTQKGAEGMNVDGEKSWAHCPDCVDGKVSIEQLAEFWTRKHQAPQRFEIEPSPDDEDDLRAVKPS